MKAIKSVIAAFSTFSRIPMPKTEWDEDYMRYLMPAFPLVGVVVGLALFAWCQLCLAFPLSPFAFAVGVTVLPLLITGGIHVDGFCDVVDALSSHAEPERKRAILKDPHVGAFAVIGVTAYLLVFAACAHELTLSQSTALALLVMPVLCRCCSGLTALVFPRSASQGMLSLFGQSADKKICLVVLVIELAACLAFVGWLSLPLLAAMVVALAACTLLLHRIAMKEFGGMSGDLSGFYLQVCKLALLFCIALAGGLAWF
ncbi:MAG: adenosylcobinamide-GDP ribazoletransferase [Coriobacteriia bacterium]|nr:adenosylcobinamide-GDP ribazoletransferase [Coriobacteriia bacterium]